MGTNLAVGGGRGGILLRKVSDVRSIPGRPVAKQAPDVRWNTGRPTAVARHQTNVSGYLRNRFDGRPTFSGRPETGHPVLTGFPSI